MGVDWLVVLIILAAGLSMFIIWRIIIEIIYEEDKENEDGIRHRDEGDR